MYDLIDRPVASLPAFERETLGAIRRWVHAFTLAGAIAATPGHAPIDDAMRAIDEGSTEDIVVQRPCFASVDESEAVLLALWRMVRDGDGGRATALAGAMIGRDHVARLIGAIDRMVCAG